MPMNLIEADDLFGCSVNPSRQDPRAAKNDPYPWKWMMGECKRKKTNPASHKIGVIIDIDPQYSLKKHNYA